MDRADHVSLPPRRRADDIDQAVAAYGHRTPSDLHPRDRLNIAVGVLSLVVLLLFVAVGVVLSSVHSIRATQDRNREVGLRSRAVTCTILAALGLHTTPACTSKEMHPYFDPATVPLSTGGKNTKAILALLCDQLAAQHRTDPACPGP